MHSLKTSKKCCEALRNVTGHFMQSERKKMCIYTKQEILQSQFAEIMQLFSRQVESLSIFCR